MGKNADKNNSEYGHFSHSVSIEEFFYKIRPYLKDNTNNFKKSDTWKIQLMIAINFMFSKDNDEESLMHSKNTPIYRYHAPLRILLWLNNQDLFRSVTKRGNQMISLKLEKTKYKHQTKTFLQAIY